MKLLHNNGTLGATILLIFSSITTAIESHTITTSTHPTDPTLPSLTAITTPMFGPPSVNPPCRSSSCTPRPTTSLDLRILPTSDTVSTTTSTVTLQPTTISSALYSGTLIPIAKFEPGAAPTVVMAQAEAGCTAVCGDVDGRGNCVALDGCMVVEKSRKVSGSGAGAWEVRVIMVMAGLAIVATGMAMV